jgi:hypothetical protein
MRDEKSMKLRAKLGGAAFLGLALGGAGCGANTDPSPGTKFAGSCDMPVPAGQACFDVLSDFELNLGLTFGHGWAGGGSWAGDADASNPPKPKPIQAALDPPRGTSAHAFHITEDGSHTQWGSVWYAILNSMQAVDLSGYTGLSFWAKSDGPPIAIKVALADYGSYPDTRGGVPPLCDVTDNSVGGLGCYDDYSIRIYPDAVWRRYDIAFSSLTTGGWGLLHAFDPRRVYSIKFAVLPKIAYSEWMDDIGFYLKK